MPVSRRTAGDLSNQVAGVYARAEVRLLRLMASHLEQGHGSPQWMDAKLAELQMFRRRASQIMGAATTEALDAAGGAITTAYGRGLAAGEGELAALGIDGKAPRLAEYAAEALVRAHQGVLQGLGPLVVRQAADDYRDAVLAAAAGTLTGAATRKEDAQAALDMLARKGITGFTDAKGRRWGLQSYVDMATRTVTAQAAVQGHMDRLEDGGISLFIVSNSPRECPLCAKWEGKVLSRGPVPALARNALTGKLEQVRVDGTVEEATRAGLFHPNCTHNLSGYVHGATKRGDATRNAEGYAEKQRQRALERGLRDWKRRQATAITPEAKRLADAKVRQWQQALAAHTRETGLPRKYDREAFDVKPLQVADDRLGQTALELLDDDTLEAAVQDLTARGDFGPRFEQLAAELDTRDQARHRIAETLPPAADPLAEQEALNRLLFGEGYADRAEQGIRRRKVDPEKQLRSEYDTWVHTQWIRAEEECRGHLLSKAGERAVEQRGFDVRDLFTRKQRSLEWASEELQRWFAEPGNQRMSYPEFRSGRMDDKNAREARARLRNRGFESEFG